MNAMESLIHPVRTKIVATVGPACFDLQSICDLVNSGVDVFRLNMAHGTHDDHLKYLEFIREASVRSDRPLAVLVDLAGPKFRLGNLEPDPFECHQGEQYFFARDPESAGYGELSCTYAALPEEVDIDDRIMLADGTVEMRVEHKSSEGIHCRAMNSGVLRSRQGVNLPGVKLSVAAMDEKDRADAAWAAAQDVDFISLSFVRSAGDIDLLRQLLREHGSKAQTVAKIEKPEALNCLDAIVQAADAIMVARGDLGVEIDVAEMPIQQKRIIDTCNRLKKPVIVATQMLDSMQHSPQPTRAEATDVANAILDGTDACMLSGETAIGSFPVQAVQMMNRIMQRTEQHLRRRDHRERRDVNMAELVPDGSPLAPITAAVIQGAALIAEQVSATVVAIATRSGATALAKSKQRDFIPTIAVSNSQAVRRRMCLYWGINPLNQAPENPRAELIRFIDRWGRENGCFQIGDRVVVVTGTGLERGAHNVLMVHEVQ